MGTQIAYLLAVLARCIWVMETRLVETVFAYVELCLSTVAAIGLCYLTYKLSHTTQRQSTPWLRIYATAPMCMLLAFLFHPGDTWLSMQILVSYTMFQEAMGLLP